MIKRLLVTLLVLCVALVLLPTTALAAGHEVKFVSHSLTLGWEKYVVYEYDGVQLRSDQLSPKFNKMLWDKLNNDDKAKVTSAYNIYYRDLKQQFGETSAKEMNAGADGLFHPA